MSDNNIQLKKAKKKDFSKIAQIYSDSFREYPYNEPWTQKKAVKKLKIFSKYCDIWKILYKKELAGFAIINSNAYCPGEVVFIEEIAIKKDSRGKGIGKEAIQKIMQKYKKKGYKYFQLVSSKNSKAYNLYLNLGFKPAPGGVLLEQELK